MIFRISVSGYEDYCPIDYINDSKTPEEFKKDVSELLDKCNVEGIGTRSHAGGKSTTCFVTVYDIQKYLDVNLSDLGYTKPPMTEIDLGGKCIYDELDNFAEIFPDHLKSEIIKHNELVCARQNAARR